MGSNKVNPKTKESHMITLNTIPQKLIKPLEKRLAALDSRLIKLQAVIVASQTAQEAHHATITNSLLPR